MRLGSGLLQRRDLAIELELVDGLDDPAHLGPGGHAEGCVVWTPPVPGHWCIEVLLQREGAESLRSLRNIDMDEPLRPGEPHGRIIPVGNPFDHTVTIHLELEKMDISKTTRIERIAETSVRMRN